MDKLSGHLQKMWATAEHVEHGQATTSLGRYDVSTAVNSYKFSTMELHLFRFLKVSHLLYQLNQKV